MKEILIFAGTTEGRELSECLAATGIAHTLCVATDYGEVVLKEHPLVKVHRGRMNQEEIREYIKTGGFGAVVDATHSLPTHNSGTKPPLMRLAIWSPYRSFSALCPRLVLTTVGRPSSRRALRIL